MKKRLVSMLCVAALSLAMLAGCGGGDGKSPGGAQTAQQGEGGGQEGQGSAEGDEGGGAFAEPDMVAELNADGLPTTANQGYPKSGGEISIWHVWSSDNGVLDSIEQVAIEPKLEELTGIKTNWTTVSRGEREEKFGILISSGQLPDLIYAQSSTYPGGVQQAVADGVFMDVTDFAKEYVPNYMALIESNETVKKEVTSDDGRLLSFYMLNVGQEGLEAEKEFLGLQVRQDWLEELNMEAPVTIDDWYEMLKAFREKKGAEAPLMIGPNGTIINGAFTSAYGVMPGFYQENGTVKFGPAEAGYKDFVETFRKWYGEGLIDQNFISNNVERIAPEEYTTTGGSGAFTGPYSYAGDGMVTMGKVTDNESFRLVPVRNPVLKEGDTVYALPLSGGIVGDPMYVSANCKDPKALGDWLNYMYSAESVMLQGYGIEGEHYTMENGVPTYTDAIMNNSEYNPSDARGLAVANFRFGLSTWYPGMLTNGVEKAQEYLEIEEAWTSQDMSKAISTRITMNGEESEEYSALYADIETFVNESITRFIMGTKPMEEWDAFVQQLHDMNVDRCIEIQQAALDRYYAR